MAASRLRHTPTRRTRRVPAHPRPKGPQAEARYGPKRLGALYEISKLLTNFIETVEQTVLTLLAIMTRELPLRSVILIEKTDARPKTIVWHAPNMDADSLRAAEVHALKSFIFLTGSGAAPAQAAEASTSVLMPATAEGAPSDRAPRGKFMTCPLIVQGHPIFGVLHLEGSASFELDDIQFVNSIANQLAIALDRYHTRLSEIALRKDAEESRRHAELEVASRERVEQEVRKLNEELERRVAERTAQFQDTIKELHAFTYSISHDLRAPLRHVHGFSQLLLASSKDAECRKYAERIMAASAGMDAMINDLLAYSRLTLEEIKLAPVSLSAVMARVRAGMEQELGERKAQLDVSEPLPRVMGHEAALTQAVSNLLSNAVKFTAPGAAPRILVRAELTGGRVRLWVEDNGIGIAPEHQERIFGVFQRLHRLEEYPGTGIGLAIVRRTLERLKGRSGVESQPGQGSRFWIELEKADDDA